MEDYSRHRVEPVGRDSRTTTYRAPSYRGEGSDTGDDRRNERRAGNRVEGSSYKRHDQASSDDRRLEYWLPAQDIDFEVLTSDLQFHLGADTVVRWSDHPDGRSGFFIKSSVPVTIPMIKDLKADTSRWMAEKLAYGRHPVYRSSTTHHDRMARGPSIKPKLPDLSPASRMLTRFEVQRSVALRLKEEGQTHVTRGKFDNLVDEQMKMLADFARAKEAEEAKAQTTQGKSDPLFYEQTKVLANGARTQGAEEGSQMASLAARASPVTALASNKSKQPTGSPLTGKNQFSVETVMIWSARRMLEVPTRAKVDTGSPRNIVYHGFLKEELEADHTMFDHGKVPRAKTGGGDVQFLGRVKLKFFPLRPYKDTKESERGEAQYLTFDVAETHEFGDMILNVDYMQEYIHYLKSDPPRRTAADEAQGQAREAETRRFQQAARHSLNDTNNAGSNGAQGNQPNGSAGQGQSNPNSGSNGGR